MVHFNELCFFVGFFPVLGNRILISLHFTQQKTFWPSVIPTLYFFTVIAELYLHKQSRWLLKVVDKLLF